MLKHLRMYLPLLESWSNERNQADWIPPATRRGVSSRKFQFWRIACRNGFRFLEVDKVVDDLECPPIRLWVFRYHHHTAHCSGCSAMWLDTPSSTTSQCQGQSPTLLTALYNVQNWTLNNSCVCHVGFYLGSSELLSDQSAAATSALWARWTWAFRLVLK